MSELQKYVLAYFLASDALAVNVDGRFYRRQEFIQIFEDRIFHATQQIGHGVVGRYPTIASYLVDKLIEGKALSTSNDKLSGITHQFDTGKYRTFINELTRSDDICRCSQQGGPHFWTDAFAVVSKAERPGDSAE